MAAPLDAFAALPKVQQAGIVAAIMLLAAVTTGYIAYADLQRLGPDPDSALPEFLLMDSGGSLWAQIEQTNTQIDQTQRIIDTRPQVEAELAALKSEIEVARGLLPQSKNKDEMRQLLEKYANEVGPQFGTVEFGGVTIDEQGDNRTRQRGAANQPQFEAVVYKCRLRTTMESLIAYIDRVETSSDRFMAVRRFSVTPGNLSVDEKSLEIVHGLHDVDLDIVTYVYSEDAQ
ncbi:MAG: hypothetical protein ACOCXA_07400 [Planctomycetota bacterium]